MPPIDVWLPALAIFAFAGGLIGALIMTVKQSNEHRRQHTENLRRHEEDVKRYEEERNRQAAQAKLYDEYLLHSGRTHEVNVKGNELLEESNRLLRELINEVRNDRATR